MPSALLRRGKVPQKIYWEGNILNKISKKIVSLVTMAAFALTLIPAAAFADPGKADDGTTATVTAVDYDTAKVEVKVGQTDFNELEAQTGSNIVVWATDSNNAVVSVNDVTYTVEDGAPAVSYWNTNYAVLANPDTVDDVVTVEATFDNPGTYTLHAAVNSKTGNSAQDMEDQEIGDGTDFIRANFADRSKSEYGVFVDDELQATAGVNINEDLTTTFKINDWRTEKTDSPLKNVKVWAVDSRTDAPTSYLTVDGQTVGTDYMFDLDEVFNNQTINIKFTAAGEYTLYAAAEEGNDLNRLIGSTKVTVTDTTEVDSMVIEASWLDNGTTSKTFATGVFTLDNDAKTYTLDLTQVKGFNFNGIDKVVLNGTAYDGKDPALRQTINFAASEPNTVVKLNPTSDNTSNTGTFETAFTMESQKNTVITITDANTGVSYDVNVIAQKTSATDIDCTKTGGYVLATTDKDWTAKVNANFNGAVEFMVTDEKGNAVEGLKTKDFVLDVQGKPEKTSSLVSSDLKIVEIGDGLYTLGVKAAEVKADNKILTEGKYEVRVALKGVDSENDNIGVTFTAAEFDKIEDVELNITDDATGVELDDQITLNTTATVSLVYVDGNGVKIACPTGFSWNATNSALAIQSTNGYKLVMKPDTIEHQGVVGSTVLVQAAVDGYGLATKELTIVSSYNTYSLELDPAEGPVNEYNKVDLNVLNSDGDVAKNINGNIKVVVADSSNEDAKVSVKEASPVEKGEGALTIYASQETELELVVTVEDGNKIVAADTLTYTVGAADPLAGRTVVMTIDSTEYVVNNNIITGDAAPYVDSNWRTMVPIRALAESFDAEVYWNQDDETVTIKFDAGTEIVMTVGEDTYTVNGAEATMDTEPVNAGDRVYVPIRFAAEGLGFSVTPLYNDAGLTASVVFQR